MVANVEAADEVTTPTAAGASPGSTGDSRLANIERSFSETARKVEKTMQGSLEQLRAQSRAYADTAGQQLDEAQRYVVERVRERPLAATGVAVGLGLVFGLLLAGGRRR